MSRLRHFRHRLFRVAARETRFATAVFPGDWWRNVTLLAGNNLLAPIFSIGLVLVIARLRGPELLGQYSLLMTLVLVGRPCVSLGLPVLIVRDTAKHPGTAGALFSHAATLTFSAATVLLGGVLVFRTLAATNNTLLTSVVIITASLIPSAVMVCAESVLLGLNRVVALAVLTIIENTARAALGIIAMLCGYGLISLSLAVLCAASIQVLFAACYLRSIGVRTPLPADMRVIRRILTQVPVLGAIPILNALYARLDILFLSLFRPWADLGLYTAARRIVDLAETLAVAYSRMAYPVLSARALASPADFLPLAKHALGPLLLILVIITVNVSTLSNHLIYFLFGTQLLPAGGILAVLAWALIPSGLALLLANVLFAQELQHVDLRTNAQAATIAACACLALVPWWGALGAALAILASRTCLATLQYRAVTHSGFPMRVGKTIFASVGLAALTTTAVRLLTPASTLGGLAVSALASVSLLAGMFALLNKECVSWLSNSGHRLSCWAWRPPGGAE